MKDQKSFKEISRKKGGQRRSDFRHSRHKSKVAQEQSYNIYGFHPVLAALQNPRRSILKLIATPNGLARIKGAGISLDDVSLEEAQPRQLDKLVGKDAVHQGMVLITRPLEPMQIEDLADVDLVLVLDQVTDPHNVGAIMRSAVAMGAGAIITTKRQSAPETGVLAKSASGALDLIEWIETRNLSKTLEYLNELQFQSIGLDSEGPADLAQVTTGQKIALVMGAEGSGLRQKTRETCMNLARMDMSGPIKSLNVSNAAAIALYVTRQHLDGKPAS